MELLPSSKSQRQESTLPSGSLLVSVKVTVRISVAYMKSAVGAWFRRKALCRGNGPTGPSISIRSMRTVGSPEASDSSR